MTYTLPGLMLCTFMLGFLPIMQRLQIHWNNGDNSYCYLIVPLFVYLCWEKKAQFRFGEFSWNLWGSVPVMLSILLMVFGELGSIVTFLYLGLWGVIVGGLFILYGWRLRQLLLPIIILAFIVPLPPYINRILTFNLKLAASSLAVMLLRLANVSVLQDGNIIDLGITQLQVVDACSGLRYFMPLILMALLFGYFYGRRWWQYAILLVGVIPLSIVVNGIRIFFTGMLHVWGKPELAEDFFHDFSGWVVFMVAGAVLLGMALVLRKMEGGSKVEVQSSKLEAESPKRKGARGSEAQKIGRPGEKVIGGVEDKGGRRAEEQGGQGGLRNKDKRLTVDGSPFTVSDESNASITSQINEQKLGPETDNCKPKTDKDPNAWRKPVAITVILCILFVGSGYALQRLPSAANLPARRAFESFPMTIGGWEAKRDYLSEGILNSLWADDYVSATYYRGNHQNAIHLLIPFYEYQGTRHTAHAPQSCMLGGGWALTDSRERMVTATDGTRFSIMTSVWKKGDTRLLGSYVFFQRGRIITSPWMNKYWLMVDAFTRRRTDGALVRIEMPMAPHQSIDDAYEVLAGFWGAVYSVLPAYVPL